MRLRLTSVAIVAALVGCASPPPGTRPLALTGKDGAKTVSGTEIVNVSTPLSASALNGTTTLNVVDGSAFAVDDLILLVAAQGATMDTTDSNSYGAIAALGPAGQHELWELSQVSGNTLTLRVGCGRTGLASDYLLSAHPQVVRVPQYTTLSVPAGATVTASPWDGSSGGVVAIHVASTATIDGTIDASSLGFRGGTVSLGSSTILQQPSGYRDTAATGGEKGEGVAGSASDYDGLGGRYGRGAPANGGGGGNGYLGGGGGGAGADGASATAYSGQGTMNAAVGSGAFMLDPDFASSGGPGGGRGGYTLSAFDQDAQSVPPGSASWGGNDREQLGGLGGHPLVASSRLFLGGGGGAGSFDGAALPPSPAGARGGGVIYLMAESIAGAGALHADGQDGRDGTLTGTGDSVTVANGGGAGGGGGGGMVVLRASGTTSVSVSARGGRGGNLSVGGTFFLGMAGAAGPGGGGAGGGVVTGPLTLTNAPQVSGGLGGTTDAAALAEFPANGATVGDSGLSAATLTASSTPRACLPANLSITLADSADPVETGASLSYIATVQNLGPNTAYDLSATITLPSGLTPGAPTAAGWSCAQAGQVLTCTRSSLSSGLTSTITLATTAPATPTVLNVSCAITSREDPAAGNDSDSESTTVKYPEADLAITQTAPMATAAGESYTYTLSVHNNGPRDAPSVRIVDTLPSGTSFVGTSGTGWACTANGSTVTCDHGALVVDATSSLDLTVTAPALTSPATASNSATVSITTSGIVDPDGTNDTSSAMTTITPVNLAITKTDAADPVNAGASITYTITVSNPSAVDAHGISVSDPLPAGTSFVSATGSGWTCAFATGTITCTRTSALAAPAATPPITVVLVAPTMAGPIANTATLSSTATDPVLANNSATEQTTISPPPPGSADLSVDLSAPPDPITVSSPMVYTATIANAGPDAADAVQVLGTLPAGAIFVSATGTSWACSSSGTTFTCAYAASMPTGTAPPITITLTAPAQGGPITASVVITSSTPDPQVANNSASADNQVFDPSLINDPPTLTLPSSLTTLEDTPLMLDGADAPSVADPDSGPDAVELTVVATGAVFTLSTTAGLTFVVGDGVLDPVLQVRGTVADLDAALTGALVTPDRDFSGTATLAFGIDDLGHDGVGGAKQAAGTISITVVPVDDPPRALDDEITVIMDTAATKVDVLANDESGDVGQALHVVQVATPAHGTAVISADASSVSYTPAPGFVGDDGFAYTASDGNAQATAMVTVHVLAAPPPEGAHLDGGGLGCAMGGRAPLDDGLAALLLALVAVLRFGKRNAAPTLKG